MVDRASRRWKPRIAQHEQQWGCCSGDAGRNLCDAGPRGALSPTWTAPLNQCQFLELPVAWLEWLTLEVLQSACILAMNRGFWE